MLQQSSAERSKTLNVALAEIEKQFGKGAIMRLGDDKDRPQMSITPTGALSLDIALGIGGIPHGRVVEIYGPEASGKTTLTLQMAAETQKQGGVVAFVDAEHALDTAYAKNIGVKIEDLLVAQPDNGEQALQIVETLAKSAAVQLIIVDSVAALTPRAEIEGEMGDSHVGLQARLMSQALRKLTGVVSRTNCTIIFINQLRMKIGVMFGNPETTTGGNALKFYASVRLDVRRIASIKQGEEVVGNRVRVKVVKNKVASPFKEAEFDVVFGKGISVAGDVLDLAVAKEIVEKAGAWFAYKGEKLGQGRENAKDFLEKNPTIFKEIDTALRIAHNLTGAKKPELVEASAASSSAKPSTPAASTTPPAAKDKEVKELARKKA